MFELWVATHWNPGVHTELTDVAGAESMGVISDPEPDAKMVAELLNASGEYEEDFAADNFKLERVGPWGYRVLAKDPDLDEMSVEFGMLLNKRITGFLEGE